MQVRPCQKLSKERRVETALPLGAKKVTGSWVDFYHAQPVGSTFRRDIRVLHGHPGRWPTLWSPLRNPSSQHPLMSQPPSPPQHPTRPAAAPSSLDPCPGRLAQPRLSRNDYRYATKTSRGSHLPTLCHKKFHTMGQEKAREPTLCLRLPTVMYKIIIRLLAHNVEIWCASVPLLSSGANAAAFWQPAATLPEDHRPSREEHFVRGAKP